MNETNVARPQQARTFDRLEPAAESNANEIRILDEMELVLAGGGEHVNDWP